MAKSIPISKYTSLSDNELINEAQRLRYEIDNPQLSAKDHVVNLFLSIIGAGTTVSSTAGLGFMWFREPEIDPSIKNVIAYGNLKKGNEEAALQTLETSSPEFMKAYSDNKGNKPALEIFRKENKNFVNALLVTVSSFALATIVSIPLINKVQKKERSEDSATKLSHAERILAQRGYKAEVTELAR